MSRARGRLNSSRHFDHLARVRQHVAGAGKDHAGDVDVADDEPRVDRGWLLIVQQQVGRIHSARVDDRSRGGHGAEHGGRRPTPNFTYHGWSSAASNNQQHNIWRASVSYVTGAHSFKVGYQAAHEVYRQIQNVDNQLAYTFNNRTPLQFTMRIGPHIQSNRTRYDGFYARINGRVAVSRFRGRCDMSTRGAGSPRARTASLRTISSAASSSSRSRKASPASTTSRRAWARRTTSSATARRP